MIRRLLWLAVGAVLGITGYRRLVRLARAIVPGAGAVRPGSVAEQIGTVRAGRVARLGTGRWTPAPSPGRLWRPPSSQPSSPRAGRAGARWAGAQAAAFLRDVRAGMAEYLDARGE